MMDSEILETVVFDGIKAVADDAGNTVYQALMAEYPQYVGDDDLRELITGAAMAGVSELFARIQTKDVNLAIKVFETLTGHKITSDDE